MYVSTRHSTIGILPHKSVESTSKHQSPMAAESMSIQDPTGNMEADEMTPLVMRSNADLVKPASRAVQRKIALEEAKGILVLSGPLIASDAIRSLPSIVMGMLMGNVSSTDSTTVLAANSLSSFVLSQTTYVLMGGIGSALQTVCVQSFGAHQLAQLCLYAQAAVLGFAYFMPVLLLLGLNGSWMLKLVGQDPSIAHVAGVFMSIDVLLIPFVFAGRIAQSVLLAQQIVLPFVYVPILASAISVPLAYVLGYHTSLGYVGIELGSVINEGMTAAILVSLAWKTRAVTEEWPGWQWREAHDLLVRTLPLGVSSIFMSATHLLGLNIIPILCGYAPNAATAIASSNIASSLFDLAILPLLGVCTSEAIRVGSALGANQPQRVVIASVLGTVLTVVTGAVGAIACVGFAGNFAAQSTTDAATAEAATSLYNHILVLAPIMGWLVGTQAVLNACGKQSVNAVFALVSTVGISAPLGYVLATSCSLGAAGVWYGQMVGSAACSLVATAYLVRLDWARVTHEAFETTHIHTKKVSPAQL